MLNLNSYYQTDASLESMVRENLVDGSVNVILAGFPKCGTTSFAHWLNQSSSINVSNPKETFLLCREHRRENGIAAEGHLSRCFSDRPAKFRVEASTLNVYSKPLLNVLRSMDDVKVILSYRDPVDSVISWHNQVVQAEESIDPDLDKCWERSVSHHLHGEAESTFRLMQDYAAVCSYGEWIQRWRDAIGDERLLIVHADELQSGDADLRSRLDRFFGLPLALADSAPVLNRYASIRFESFYKTFKYSGINKRLRQIERNLPLAQWIRSVAKEKLFRKGQNKQSAPTQKSALGQYFECDFRLATELATTNRAFWDGQPKSRHTANPSLEGDRLGGEVSGPGLNAANAHAVTLNPSAP